MVCNFIWELYLIEVCFKLLTSAERLLKKQLYVFLQSGLQSYAKLLSNQNFLCGFQRIRNSISWKTGVDTPTPVHHSPPHGDATGCAICINGIVVRKLRQRAVSNWGHLVCSAVSLSLVNTTVQFNSTGQCLTVVYSFD